MKILPNMRLSKTLNALDNITHPENVSLIVGLIGNGFVVALGGQLTTDQNYAVLLLSDLLRIPRESGDKAGEETSVHGALMQAFKRFHGTGKREEKDQVHPGFKPDLGIQLLRESASTDREIEFPNFTIDSVTVLGRGQYSALMNILWGGKTHAASLDFDGGQLDQILTKAPPDIAQSVKTQLAADPSKPRSIELESKVTVHVVARFGKLYVTDAEPYVPLVAHEIQ